MWNIYRLVKGQVKGLPEEQKRTVFMIFVLKNYFHILVNIIDIDL